MACLELKEIEYSYNQKRKVLKGINQKFEKGTMYAILGESGCGKSTLLSLLGGLDIPQKGEILLNNVPLTSNMLVKYRRNQVSIIFQNYNLVDYLNGIENVMLVTKKSSESLLESLGLTKDEVRRNIMHLSGGQQQRIAIARGFISEAPVLLADEPTGNLDEKNADEIAGLMCSMAHNTGKCVIVVTHSKRVAAQADVILKLQKGTLRIAD